MLKVSEVPSVLVMSVCMHVCVTEMGSVTVNYFSICNARTCNHHPVLQLVQLASADISWLRGIWQSPCWWTSHAVVHLGVCLSVYFWSTCLCAHFAQTLSCKCDAILQGTTCKIHSVHKHLCPAKRSQTTSLDTHGGRQPGHLFNIGLLVSAPCYEA